MKIGGPPNPFQSMKLSLSNSIHSSWQANLSKNHCNCSRQISNIFFWGHMISEFNKHYENDYAPCCLNCLDESIISWFNQYQYPPSGIEKHCIDGGDQRKSKSMWGATVHDTPKHFHQNLKINWRPSQLSCIWQS